MEQPCLCPGASPAAAFHRAGTAMDPSRPRAEDRTQPLCHRNPSPTQRELPELGSQRKGLLPAPGKGIFPVLRPPHCRPGIPGMEQDTLHPGCSSL